MDDITWRDVLTGSLAILGAPLPRWMTPGALTVTHSELGDGTFSFTLDVSHRLFGVLIHQYAVFREIPS